MLVSHPRQIESKLQGVMGAFAFFSKSPNGQPVLELKWSDINFVCFCLYLLIFVICFIFSFFLSFTLPVAALWDLNVGGISETFWVQWTFLLHASELCFFTFEFLSLNYAIFMSSDSQCELSDLFPKTSFSSSLINIILIGQN